MLPRADSTGTLEVASTPKAIVVVRLASSNELSVRGRLDGRARRSTIEEQRVIGAHSEDQQQPDQVQKVHRDDAEREPRGDASAASDSGSRTSAARAMERSAKHSNNVIASGPRRTTDGTVQIVVVQLIGLAFQA